MKTLTIYTRNVLERTQFKKCRFKKVQEVIISYDNKIYKNCDTELNNEKLKIKFTKALETRSTKALEKYLASLSRKESDLFIKYTIANVVK